MTFPTIPTSAGSRILVTLNTAGGATKTFPNLSSLTKNAGDLLIAIAITYDGNSTNAEFSSWGGSFTEFVDQATTATMGIGAAYKFSTGSETGTFTVTTADTSANDSVLILMSIAGAHSSTAPAGGTIANGTGSAADPGALDPAGWGTEDTLWISVCGSGEDATTATFTAPSAAPTNYGSSFISSVTADVIGGVYGAVAFRQNATSSENVGAWTVDTTNARNSALLIAVRGSEHGTATPAAISVPFALPAATGSGGATGVVTDDFNRANGAPGSDWQEEASGSFLIVSNQLVLQSGAGGTRIDWNHDLTSTDHYCEVDVTGVLTNVAAPVVRCSSDVSTTVGYIGFLDPSGTGAYIARLSDFGMVDTDAGYTHGAAHRLRLEAEGTTLRFYVDEGLVCSGTDSTFTTQVRVGASQAQTGQSLDNFEAGPLGGGGDGTATPAAITTAAVLPAATVTGAGNTSPAVITTAATFPAAIPLAGTTTSPAVITTAAALPAASASGASPGTATPTAIATAATLPAATVTGAGNRTPAVITTAATLPAATVTGAGNRSPAVITTAAVLPAPALLFGQTVTPAAIPTATILPAATATGGGGGGGPPTVTLLSHTFVGWDNPVALDPTVVSGSITPGTNCLLVAMLSEFGNSTSALTSTLPTSSGSGPSWTLVEKTNPSGGYTGGSGIWTAAIGGSSPGSFTVSATYVNGSGDFSMYLWSIFKVTGYDTGTPTGGKETTTGNAGNGNVDITLDAASGSNDVTLAQCLVDENSANRFSTFGTGTWTTSADGSASGHLLAYNIGYRSGSTSATVNWSDVNSGSDDWDSTQAAVVIKGGAAGVDGTATPAALAATVALPAASATGASPGTATPARIIVTPTVPAATAKAGSTAAPAVIPLAATFPGTAGLDSTVTPDPIVTPIVPRTATASGATAGTATPAVIARTFALPALTVTGAGNATPARTLVTVTVPAASATGAATGTATPAAITIGVTLPAATPLAGSTVTPAATTVVVNLPAASASGATSGTATPAAIPVTVTIPAASASGASPGTATPNVITTTVTMPTAAPRAGWTATPAATTVTFTLPPVAAGGSKIVTPAVIPVTVAVPPATTQAGTLAAPNVIAVVTVVPGPTVVYGNTVNPAAIALAVTVHAVMAFNQPPDPHPVTVEVQDAGHTITVTSGGTGSLRSGGHTASIRELR